MICFRDTTFCGSPNCQGKCGRQFTEADREAAKKWWGGDGAPIAFGNFCDANGEAIYKRLPEPEAIPECYLRIRGQR